MPSNIVQIEALQPFMKLAQANMELWNQFAFAPEVTSEAVRGMQAFLEQAQLSAASLTQSQAWPALMQGLVKNYTDFLAEIGESANAMIGQAQASFVEQAQGAA